MILPVGFNTAQKTNAYNTKKVLFGENKDPKQNDTGKKIAGIGAGWVLLFGLIDIISDDIIDLKNNKDNLVIGEDLKSETEKMGKEMDELIKEISKPLEGAEQKVANTVESAIKKIL